MTLTDVSTTWAFVSQMSVGLLLEELVLLTILLQIQLITTNFTSNRPTDIWLTKDGSKRTNHVLQSSQPMTSWLNWQTTNNNMRSSTNEDNDQTYNIYWRLDSQFTRLWWWLLLRLSKHQSMSPQTVLLRTTLTWTIVIYRPMIWLLGSNHLQFLITVG